VPETSWQHPYASFSTNTCATSTWNNTITEGSAGRTYLVHPDGSRAFVSWGRSIHVNENGNSVESYLYPTQNLDWFSIPFNFGISATVTLVPTNGPSVAVQCPYSG
jgi:hypothetical protein